jgi:hypothetical protein
MLDRNERGIMKWHLHITPMGDEIAVCVYPDKVVSGLASEMPEYLEWIAKGNTPQEWPPQ